MILKYTHLSMSVKVFIMNINLILLYVINFNTNIIIKTVHENQLRIIVICECRRFHLNIAITKFRKYFPNIKLKLKHTFCKLLSIIV